MCTLPRSLNGNTLCGLYQEGYDMRGTYTSEGIIAICEGLKASSITSLRCAGCPLHHVKAPCQHRASSVAGPGVNLTLSCTLAAASRSATLDQRAAWRLLQS